MITRRHLLATAAVASLAKPSLSNAAEYPERMVTLLVGWPPGGATDNAARLIADHLGTAIGKKIVVENRPGAAGAIGARAAAKAKSDGYSIFFGTASDLAVNPTLQKAPTYDVMTDFAPISQVNLVPLMIVVHSGSPFMSIADLVAAAKKEPGKYSHASFGIASTPHLVAELFKSKAGVDMLNVPFNGAAQSLTELITGRVTCGFEAISAILPHVQSGSMRALAVTSEKRWPEAPDVPTMIESGYPDFVAGSWAGLLAPAGTDAAIVQRLSAETQKIAASRDFIDQMTRRGLVAKGSTPEQFKEFIASEINRWRSVAREANIVLPQ